jgi:hypothetical protein
MTDPPRSIPDAGSATLLLLCTLLLLLRIAESMSTKPRSACSLTLSTSAGQIAVEEQNPDKPPTTH